MVKMSHNFRSLCFICSLNQTNLHISIQIVHSERFDLDINISDKVSKNLRGEYRWTEISSLCGCHACSAYIEKTFNLHYLLFVIWMRLVPRRTNRPASNYIFHSRIQMRAHRTSSWEWKHGDSFPSHTAWSVQKFFALVQYIVYIYWMNEDEEKYFFRYRAGIVRMLFWSSQHQSWKCLKQIKIIKIQRNKIHKLFHVQSFYIWLV